MSFVSAATLAPPLTARKPSADAPRTQAPAASPRRVDPGAFQAFVDANYHPFRDYIARRLDATHAAAAEDALQEALVTIWNEWAEWPTDAEDRTRFARQALRIAAAAAVRKRAGRTGSRTVTEVIVDFTDLDGDAPPNAQAERLARDLGRAIAEQSLVKDQLGYLEKASLIAAIATLTDLEQRVLFMTAQGDDCRQIATDLGVTHQQAREALMRARRLCRMLIEHADGQKVSEKEAALLWQYRDGQLSGKRARELKRHIDHCTACQRLIGLEDAIQTNGALVILPIPVLLLAVGAKSTGLLGTTTAGHATANVAGVGVTSGSVLAPAVPATTWGSVLAGLTAKAAVGLAGLAVTASFAGVYKLAHDRQATHTTATTDARPATGIKHDALAAAPAPPARHATRRPASHHARHATTTHHTPHTTPSRSHPAPTTTPTVVRQPASTPTARVAQAPATKTTRPADTSGREFILDAP